MLVKFLKRFSMRKKLRIKFLMMDLPSRILVKFLERFPMRKKLCFEFLMMDWPSGMLVEFLKQFSMRKSCISSFWWWMDLPSGILVEFLKWFSTRKSRASIFALVLWSYLYDTDRLKKGQKITSKEALRTLNDTKNHRFYENEKKPFITGERKAWKSDLQLCYFI